MRCASGPSTADHDFGGVPAKALLELELAPPAPEVTHVVAWAEYGYSADLRPADLLPGGGLPSEPVQRIGFRRTGTGLEGLSARA